MMFVAALLLGIILADFTAEQWAQERGRAARSAKTVDLTRCLVWYVIDARTE